MPINARQILEAACKGDVDTLGAGLKECQKDGIDIKSIRSEQRESLLHIAAQYGQSDAVRLLATRTPELLATVDNADNSVLHALYNGGYNGRIPSPEKASEITQILLNAAPSLAHDEDEQGRLPVHKAARAGDSATLKVMLARAPMLVNVVDDHGKTPFAYADGRTEVLSVLTQALAASKENIPLEAYERVQPKFETENKSFASRVRGGQQPPGHFLKDILANRKETQRFTDIVNSDKGDRSR